MVGGEYAKTIKSTKKFKDLLIQDALVVDKKSLISVNENMMLFDALKILTKNDILSVPIISNRDGKDYVIGFIDSLDVVAFVVSKADDGDIANVNDTCKSVLEKSKRKNIHFVTPTTPLTEALKLLLEVHRVGVISPEYEGIHEYPFPFEYFQNVVTQSDVFAIIVNYTYAIPDTKKLSLSLSQLGFKPKKIECCRSTLSTSDALLQMYNHSYTALGVVDDTEKLINYLTAGHMKKLDKASIWDVYLPVSKFLMDEQATFETFDFDTPLQKVLEFMKDFHYHRIFLVDKQKKPVGLLSLRDFLSEIPKQLDML